MVIRFCEVCAQRYIVMPHIGDYIHSCTGANKALVEEDVLDFHTTFTDSEGVVHDSKKPATALWSGVVNKLQGTLGGVMGEDVENVTVRGNRTSLYRQRQKFAYKLIPNKNY